MKTITKEKAAEIIRNTNGKIFTVKFTKKDKSERVMQARLGVKRYLAGGTSTIADKPNLIGCYDVQAGKQEKGKGYRCINIETLKSLKANGEEYHVKQL